MTNRNLPIYLGAIGLIVFLAAIGWQTAETKHLVSAATQTAVAPVPNLDGEKAKKYLEQNNLSRSLNKAVQAARYSVNWVERAPVSNQSGAFEAKNLQQEFAAYFTNGEVNLVSGEAREKWSVSLKLTGYGRGGQQWAVGSGQWAVNKTKVSTSHQISTFNLNIDELFENKPEGLEQSFIIEQSPKSEVQSSKSEDDQLKLVLSLSGDLHAKLAEDGQSLSLVKKSGETVLRYDKLKSWDANGKELTSRMELNGDELSLLVDDAEAVYPITIDPTFTQIKKLTAADGTAGDTFGSTIAVSGNTAVIGAVSDNAAQGSAYVFERNSGGANNWSEIKKLTASDGAGGDVFGSSVAIDGNTVAVGSNRAAYIFERNAGGTNNWGEVKMLVEDVGTAGDFGNFLSLSENTIIVGSSTNNPELGVGFAFVYDRDEGGLNNWGLVKQLTLEGGVGSDSFPGAIAISSDTAIVASNGSQGKAQIFRRDEGGENNWGRVRSIFVSNGGFVFPTTVGISGDTAVIGKLPTTGNNEVYVLGRNTGGAENWGLVKTLTASDGAAGDAFGIFVGISNNRIIVGAGLDDVGANTNQGSAYIFERNAGGADNWGEIKQIAATDGAKDDRFGVSVAIDGNTAMVGATLDDVGSNIDQGAAYAFIRQNTTWVEDAQPLPANCTVEEYFGTSVAIDGDTAIVGATQADVGANANQGAAYIFERNAGGSGNWGLVKTIAATDGAANDQFGNAVAISGDRVIVGSPKHDIGANADQGASYIFERNRGGPNNWGQVKKLFFFNGMALDGFGVSVGISGDKAIVGVPYDDAGAFNNLGTVFVFERSTGGTDNWGQISQLFDGLPENGELFGYAVAISGDTAVASAFGDDIGSNPNRGSAFVLQFNQTVFVGGKKITASDGTAFDQFGASVAVAGDTVIVGAFLDDVGANNAQGSAYIFARNTGGANNWGEVKKLVAADAAADEEFGVAVSISGDTATVSSIAQVGANTRQGSAYIFKQNNSGANNWGQVRKLVAADGAAQDYFGSAVAISGETVIASSPGDDVGGAVNQGSAYIFVSNVDAWNQQAMISPPPPTNCGTDDQYGFSVAVSGDTAVIGAPSDDVGINTNQGSVYILERNQGGANNWGLVKLLTASDGTTSDRFGISVSISGDSVIVGAFGDNNAQGSAYVYERNSGGTNNFGEVKKIVAVGGTAGDQFGYAVAINGNAVIVGAFLAEVGANDFQGSAYIFERNFGGTNNWGQVKKLVASDGTTNDQFGVSVSISGGTAIVGTPFDDAGANTNQGSVYIFERNTGGANNWGEAKKLVAADSAMDDAFGLSVAVSSNTLIVGAVQAQIGTNFVQGAGYIFERNTGGADNWGQVKKLTASDGAANDIFGTSVSISGDAAIVGSPFDDIGTNTDQGSAYIFVQNAGGADNWGQVSKLTATDGAAGDSFGSAVAVSGDNFLVGAYLAELSSPSADSNTNTSLSVATDQGATYVFRGVASAPTAAPASISGRVIATTGAPLGSVVINLMGSQSRKTITDANGSYRFDNVDTGGFYTVTPTRLNYHFDPGNRSFSLLANMTDAVFTATPDAVIVGNVIDTPEYFVRQHYLDFLGREPDEAGFNFWSDQILECGSDAGCLERRRINVSAAYFLSIEFQETGGLVDGLYRASYGRRPNYAEFMPDSSAIARGVVVGRNGWEQQLETNKAAFVDAWVQRAAFIGAYGNLSNDGYVDQLIAHTGVNRAASERAALVAGLTDGTLTRAAVLRQIVENRSFIRAKFNQTFVMMQYFGYLRRDPDESGYQFWLTKLNEFNGNFEQAEMVKAFLVSGEYRRRFGP